MSYIFIELYTYRTAWRDLTVEDRAGFVESISSAIAQLPAMGIETIAYGANDADTDQRAPYDFFCVYRSSSLEGQKGFESAVRASGWYDHFDQVNARGAARAPEEVLRDNVGLILPA